MNKPLKIFGIGMTAILLASLYLYMAYNDFTCHGCMSVPTLTEAVRERSLVAIYKCNDERVKDTLYLTQGSVHGGGYHFYTEAYFAGYTGVFDQSVSAIESITPMVRFSNGKPSSYIGVRDIPDRIICLDSTGLGIFSFQLLKEYPKNIDLGSKISYIREWKTILTAY